MRHCMAPRRILLMVMTAVLLASCTTLPSITLPDQASLPDTVHRCGRPFLHVPYRFVHAIEFTVPGGGMGTVVGVTMFDPASEVIRSAIMTIEGFVLFDARYEEGVRVNRAVPPFDKEQFANYMMEDIRLMFLAPRGRLAHAGLLADGSSVCRYEGEGMVVDVIVHEDDAWEIATYAGGQKPLRKVRASSVRDGIPEMLELSAFGFREYSLRLKLISAEAVSPDALRPSHGESPEDE